MQSNNYDAERAKEIGRELALFSSFERAFPLYMAIGREPTAVFWKVVLEWWNACDGIWHLRHDFLAAFRLRKADLNPYALMGDDDRSFFDGLPERIVVHRGSDRRRVRGLGWTTNKERAAWFAKGGRLGRQRDPVIATASIAKANVFFVSAARKESEVVLDPYAISRPRLEPLTAAT